jgi:hypothetical protein
MKTNKQNNAQRGSLGKKNKLLNKLTNPVPFHLRIENTQFR